MSTPLVLVIDPQFAGIAGDMFVAALLDLGAKQKPVISAMESAVKYVPDSEKIKVTPKPVTRSHIGGLFLDIQIRETYETRSGKILLDAIKAMSSDLELSPPAAAYAERAIRFLIEAEASIHRHTPEEVHLHGAGSADTVIDIIGAAIALQQLQLIDPKTIEHYSLPIAVGGGTFPSGHGQLAAPGPAVTKISTEAGLHLKGGPLEYELATPTGVALIAALSPNPVTVYPSLRPIAVGYGAGTAELPGVPNLLRLIKGERLKPSRPYQDQVIVLETNVDDVTGETLGFIIDRLITEGAKDVTILPTTTKKSRPGHLISVIAAPEDEHLLAQMLMRETGSLGVRSRTSRRHLLAREIQTVPIQVGKNEVNVRVKVALDHKGVIHQIKAEYEDVRQAAEKTGRSLVEIARNAEEIVRQQIRKKRG